MNLLGWIEKQGMTRGEFAKKIKASEMTVYNIASGRDLCFSKACRIVDATRGEVGFMDLMPRKVPYAIKTRLKAICNACEKVSEDHSESESEE